MGLVATSFYVTYVAFLTTGVITFIEALRARTPYVRHVMNLETCISVIAAYFYSQFVENVKNIPKNGFYSVVVGLPTYTIPYLVDMRYLSSQYNELSDILLKASCVFPCTKKTSLVLDNLPRHSGYMQWIALTKTLKDHLVCDPRNIEVLCTDRTLPIFDMGKIMTRQERSSLLEQLHDKAQNIFIKKMLPIATKIIKEYPGITQSKLSKILFEPEQESNCWNTYTIVHVLEEAGAINIEKTSYNNKQLYYKKDVLPNPLPFISRNFFASKNEALFAYLLNKYDIPFQYQVVFKDCKYKRPLPFDFMLDVDGVSHLVEIQGEQHFQVVKMFNKNEAGLNLQKEKDARKKKWAEDNDYCFHAIRYDANFEEELQLILDM